MFQINSAKQAKKSARALEKALAPLGMDLQRGQALDVVAKVAGFADWNALAAVLPAATPSLDRQKEPAKDVSILSVPFRDVSSVVIDGKPFEVQYIDEDVFPWIYKWSDPANPYAASPDVTVLDLWYLEDGLVFEEQISVETLLCMKWDAAQGCFVTKDGDSIHFMFSVAFGKSLETSTVETSVQAMQVSEGYRVYQTLKGTWRWSRGQFGTTDMVDGENLNTKEEAILDAIRDAAERAAELKTVMQSVDEFRELQSKVTALGLDNDPLFKHAEAIKQKYLESKCGAPDVDYAVHLLMTECGQLFVDPTKAWEFIMDETHEDNEGDDAE